MRNYDGTEMRDFAGNVVFTSQFLSTHPLRADCKERVGYGGKKFSYVTGDGVIRAMNAIFGHGGWSTQITMERNILSEKDEKGRWCVGYLARVKVSLLRGPHGGASHEDCGSGEGIDSNKVKAHERALKSAITDAMKRAARHFGERLGNALYVKGSGVRTAPRTNRDALMELERKDRALLFGDQAVLRDAHNAASAAPPSPDKKKGVLSSRGMQAAAIATGNTHDALQKENLPQNHMVMDQSTTTTAHSLNAQPSSNGVLAATAPQQQPTADSTMGSSVRLSPIASSTSHRRCSGGTAQSLHHTVLNNVCAGVRIQNPSLTSSNNGNHNAMHPQQLQENKQNNNLTMNAPNFMATIPVVGNNGGARQNSRIDSHANHMNGKRRLDIGASSTASSHYPPNHHHNDNNRAVNHNAVSAGHNVTLDNNTKRPQVNPYCNNNNRSNKRMSV